MKTYKLWDGREVPAGKLFSELYNRTKQLGMGALMSAGAPETMTAEEAEGWVRDRETVHFDYVLGRPIKLRVIDGEITERSQKLYDRDAGEGAFEAAVTAALGESA